MCEPFSRTERYRIDFADLGPGVLYLVTRLSDGATLMWRLNDDAYDDADGSFMRDAKDCPLSLNDVLDAYPTERWDLSPSEGSQEGASSRR